MGESGNAVIQEDTVITGRIRNGGHVQIFGHVDGDVIARSLTIQPGGRLIGTAKVEEADVHGLLQGEIRVKTLLSLGATGEIQGDVHYNQIAVETGGLLSAQLRNVPPELFGDLSLTVTKGRSVTITNRDLSAIDPDDTAAHLTFQVSNARNGWVAIDPADKAPVTAFTQADINAGNVRFVHDGTSDGRAGFDVLVSDDDGANSGKAQTVEVVVRAG